MGLIIRDRREAPKRGTPVPIGGNERLDPAGPEMLAASREPMIAVCSFSPGRGTVRRWSKFRERQSRVRHRLKHRQAMQDFTVIEGVELADCRKLARAGVLTFDRLARISDAEMALAGVRGEAIEAVLEWQFEEPADVAVEPDDLTTIGGVGAKAAEALAEVGIDTFAALEAASDDDLAKVPLAPKARAGIRGHRKESAEAEKREKKVTGPEEKKG